ncbi:MAG: hypothetical protein ACLRTI_10440 [Blautia sp.]
MTRRRKKESWILSISLAGLRLAEVSIYAVIKIMMSFFYILKTFRITPLIGSKRGRKKKWL